MESLSMDEIKMVICREVKFTHESEENVSVHYYIVEEGNASLLGGHLWG